MCVYINTLHIIYATENIHTVSIVEKQKLNKKNNQTNKKTKTKLKQT